MDGQEVWALLWNSTRASNFIPQNACRFAKAIPHNSKCRYGERGAADAKPKAQIIVDAAKVSAASGGNSEPKQGQRSQSASATCPRSTRWVPQPNIIEHFGNADAVPQPPERCLSRQGGNCAVLPYWNPSPSPPWRRPCKRLRPARQRGRPSPIPKRLVATVPAAYTRCFKSGYHSTT